MLKDLLNIGFFEIRMESFPKIRTFRLYEMYRDTQMRIIITLENNSFLLKDIFFYAENSEELKFELFGSDLSVTNIIEKIKQLQKTAKPFNKSPETG